MKLSLGRPRRRWEYNIAMDVMENAYECVKWIQLAQKRAHSGLL